MGLLLKLAVLIYCIRHVLHNGRPGQTALIYAAIYLAIGCLLLLVQPFLPISLIIILGTFAYDLLTGFILFWLLDRYQDNQVLFYIIILLGIAFSVAVNFAIHMLIG